MGVQNPPPEPAPRTRPAKACGINLSATLEEALEKRIRAHRAREWLAENRASIELYNEQVEREGTFSDGLRAF